MFTFNNRVPHGFGLMVWQLDKAGGVQGVIDKCHALGIDGIFLKASDGEQTWTQAGKPTIDALHAAGIGVVCWGYVYGYPREAAAAGWALDQGADGWLIDDEVEMDGKGPIATAYGNELRSTHPNASIGFNPYPYPSSSVTQPWVEYNRFVDYCMPQLYQRQDGLGTPAQALATMESDFAYWHGIWKANGVPCPPLLLDWQGASWGGQVTPPSDITEAALLSAQHAYPLITYWEWAGFDAGQWDAMARAVPLYKGVQRQMIQLVHDAQGNVTGAYDASTGQSVGSGMAKAIEANGWLSADLTVGEQFGLPSGVTVAVVRGSAKAALTYSPADGVTSYGGDIAAVVQDLVNKVGPGKPPTPVLEINGTKTTLGSVTIQAVNP